MFFAKNNMWQIQLRISKPGVIEYQKLAQKCLQTPHFLQKVQFDKESQCTDIPYPNIIWASTVKNPPINSFSTLEWLRH